MYHFQNYLEQSLTAYINFWAYIFFTKTHKVCRSFGTKGHNKSELGQDRKSGLIDKKETYNYLLIVFIVTLYSLQKNTRFVDRVEQKVTTNPKLGQNHKSRSTEEADV